jgi:hypothetical protein
MNRNDLQLLTDARVEDAQVLMESKRWAAAYYLLGYAVECAPKACVAQRFRQDEIPEKALVNDFYSHKLDRLTLIAGLRPTLDARLGVDQAFSGNWNTVCLWSEASRYNHETTEDQARNLLAAVVDSQVGVLPWLKTRW